MFILKHGIASAFKQLNITVDFMVAVALARAIYLQDGKYYCFSFVHNTRLTELMFSPIKFICLSNIEYHLLTTYCIPLVCVWLQRNWPLRRLY
jgi:hypothetical protein